jgi:hypothetical protein
LSLDNHDGLPAPEPVTVHLLEVETDSLARAQCPVQTTLNLRVGGGHLVAGYDTTVAELRGLLENGYDRVTIHRDVDPDADAVLCWYADLTLTPPFGRGNPRPAGGGLTVYVDGLRVGGGSTDATPRRP